MKWLNIEIETLRGPEFLGAEPIERATWLSLLSWCAAQENGGVISGCSEWGSRKWQQICGVTKEETLTISELFYFDGVDLIVLFFPESQQKTLNSKRESGRTGGLAKTQAKTQAAKKNGAKGGRPRNASPIEKSSIAEENPSGTEKNNAVNPSETQAKTERNSNSNSNSKGREGGALKKTSPPPKKQNLPTGRNPAIDTALSWINSLRPSWAKTPHLTATEMHDLANSAESIAGLDPDTKQAVVRFASSPQVRKEWIFQTRQRFIANYTEAAQKAIEWSSQQSPPPPRSGSIQVGGRKGKITNLSDISALTQ